MLSQYWGKSKCCTRHKFHAKHFGDNLRLSKLQLTERRCSNHSKLITSLREEKKICTKSIKVTCTSQNKGIRSLVPHLIGPPSHWSPSHWSPNSLVPQYIIGAHWSPISLVPHLIGPLLIGPPTHWSPNTLLELIGPPSHWSPISLVPHLIGPPFH